MARPTKLTPEVHGIIVEQIRKGCFQVHAAAAAGVSDESYARWVKRGEAGDEEPYASFARDIRKAEQEVLARHLENIEVAALGDWKAASWMLEKRFPKQYGSMARHEISGPDGGPVKTALEGLTVEQLERVVGDANDNSD